MRVFSVRAAYLSPILMSHLGSFPLRRSTSVLAGGVLGTKEVSEGVFGFMYVFIGNDVLSSLSLALALATQLNAHIDWFA